MASKLSVFFAELKRRKVYRVAVVYVVVGAGIIGLADAAVPSDVWERLQIPIVVLVLVGLPIALVLAWAYDVRPEEPRDAEPSAAPEVDTSESEQRKSIVVLPFDNMSPDPGDAYFSDGLTEEIITNLSYLRSLRVISRNSAMVLKGSQKDTRAIAEELDVQYVLEGSVRKAGNDLRITAQLIDAAADEHIWAEKYDGVLEDVFGMQEQVSRSIVAALELELRSEEEQRLVERPIDNLRAYECYLKARYEFWTMTEGSLDRSLDLIGRGLENLGDNELLDVWKGMVLFQMVNSMTKAPETYEGLLEEAQQCAERALAVNPDSSPAHALQGYVFVNSGNPQGAVRHFAEALRLDPDNLEALLYLGFMGAAGGWDLDGSRHLLEKVTAVDPLTPVSEGAVSWLHWFEGDFEAAIEGFRSFSKQAEEGKSPWRVVLAYLRAAGNDLDEAVRIVDQMIGDSPDHILTSLGRFLKYAWLGEKEQALEAVTVDLERGAWWDDLWPLLMADAYALIDEQDRAFFWLDHAIEYGMTNVRYLGEHDPFLAGLRSDDRFDRLMEKAASLSESLSALANVEQIV